MLSFRDTPRDRRSHLASEVRRTYWISLVVLIVVGLVGLAIMAAAPTGNATFVGLAVALFGGPLAMSIARLLLLRQLARRASAVPTDGEAPSPLVVSPRGSSGHGEEDASIRQKGVKVAARAVAIVVVGMLLLYAFSFVVVVLISAIQVAIKR